MSRYAKSEATGSISKIYLGLGAGFRESVRAPKMLLKPGSASSGANNSLWAYLSSDKPHLLKRKTLFEKNENFFFWEIYIDLYELIKKW